MMAGTAMAQSPIKYGIKAGGNFANNTFSGNGLSMTPSSVTSFYVGGLVTTSITKKISFQPELLLSMQGYKWNRDSIPLTNNTSYLILPLMFKYNIVEGLHLEAGPQIGLLLSAKDKFGDSEDVKDQYNSLDLGANIGAEYQFPIGLFLNARYNLGLTNIAKFTAVDVTVKNKVVSLGIGFRI